MISITKTDEELQGMSFEALKEYAKELQSDKGLLELYRSQCERLKSILSAIGIAYETYKNEYVKS